MSRRRERLIQGSQSLPVDAASRVLRGDADGTMVVQDQRSRLLTAEIVGMLERAGPLVRGASEVVAWQLNAIAAQGETCLKRGEVGEAVVVFSRLGAGICAGYELIWDEESEVGMVLDRCVKGLEACLDRAATSTRGDILGALLDIAVWERTSGGYGVGERAAELVLARSTVDERRAIAAAAASVLQQAVLRARQRLGTFVVQLGGGAEVERAALLQEKGDQHRRIARLLALHEPKEAAQVLTELDDPGERTRCAELFIEHGYPDEGHKIMEGAVATRGTPGRRQTLTWLYGQATGEGDDKAAATWAEEIFREAPSVEHWGLLRASARGTLRHQLRRELLEAGEHVLLIEILLSENKAREALSKFRAVKARTPRVLAAMQRIADGVAARRPRDAARLYAEIADHHGMADEHEIAVELVFRGYQLFAAAGHMILATRHLTDFCRRHAGRDELIARIEKHSSTPRIQPGEQGPV